MSLRIANAPVSWGVEPFRPFGDPPWKTVLDEIAAAGYEGTELGPVGFLPTAAEDLSQALRDHGLKLPAGVVMTAFAAADDDGQREATVGRTCGLLKAGGAHTLILIDGLADERVAAAGRSARAPRLSRSQWNALVGRMRDAGEIAAEFGLATVVHPHAGTYVEYEDEVDRLLGDLAPDRIGLCLDTGHCVYAGIDPLALLRRHSSRVTFLHFKDIDAERLSSVRERGVGFLDAVGEGIFVPIGEGCVDFHAVLSEVERAGYDGWATVEQDRLVDSSASPLAEARQSLAHLRALGGVATQ